MPKVSVIIPVYNVEPYLRQCLDSVVNQTLTDIEIICVDDGSTDRSYQILQVYAARDSRITLLRQPNAGAGAARNVGLAVATGDYISFVDADDWVCLEMLSQLYQQITTVDADLCLFKFQRYLEQDEQYGRSEGLRVDLLPRDRTVFSPIELSTCLFQLTYPNIFTKCYKRALLQQYQLRCQTLRSCNDLFLNHTALVCAGRITYLDAVLVTHRLQHKYCITHTRGRYCQCVVQAHAAFKAFLEQRDWLDCYRRSIYTAAIGNFDYEYTYCNWWQRQRLYWLLKQFLPHQQLAIWQQKTGYQSPLQQLIAVGRRVWSKDTN